MRDIVAPFHSITDIKWPRAIHCATHSVTHTQQCLHLRAWDSKRLHHLKNLLLLRRIGMGSVPHFAPHVALQNFYFRIRCSNIFRKTQTSENCKIAHISDFPSTCVIFESFKLSEEYVVAMCRGWGLCASFRTSICAPEHLDFVAQKTNAKNGKLKLSHISYVPSSCVRFESFKLSEEVFVAVYGWYGIVPHSACQFQVRMYFFDNLANCPPEHLDFVVKLMSSSEG